MSAFSLPYRCACCQAKNDGSTLEASCGDADAVSLLSGGDSPHPATTATATAMTTHHARTRITLPPFDRLAHPVACRWDIILAICFRHIVACSFNCRSAPAGVPCLHCV